MLSIGKLGACGGAEYYLDKVANSVDDYYLGRGEAPGRWIGATSIQLGLVGQRHSAGGRQGSPAVYGQSRNNKIPRVWWVRSTRWICAPG